MPLLLASSYLMCACAKHSDQAPVVHFKNTDPAMNAAIKKAQESLDTFVAELKTPNGREFFVKVRLPTDSGGGEHFWIKNPTYRNGTFSGSLMDEPEGLKDKHKGDQVRVPRADVSDWMFFDDKGRHGAFTEDLVEGRKE